ncbi:MAG TPA: acyltransferase family protein [Acidimicrobiales bacterium]
MPDGKGVLAERNRALDGLRGVAVAAVVVYHVWPQWLPGGYLGVSVFFTLSGFLITTLLLEEWRRDGSVDARRFWARRARRLIPAAVVALALAVAITAVAGDPHQLREIDGDVTAAAAYVANWRFVALGAAYGVAYLEPSPLLHTWSLAIEEQFYLLLGLVAFLLARRARTLAPWVAVVALIAIGSVASGLWIEAARGVAGHDRIYFGTDTRAFELAAGMGLALLVHAHGAPSSRRLHGALSVVGTIALGGLVLAATQVDTRAAFVRQGGLWLIALASATTVAAVVRPGPLARLLSATPLVGLGVISYGVYLYHWPLLTLLDEERTHLDGVPLGLLQIAVSVALAALSYRYLEEPIRRQRWNVPITRLAPAAASVTAVVIVAAVAAGGLAPGREVAADVELVLPATVTAASTVPTAAEATAEPSAPPLRSVLFLGDSLVHQGMPTMTAVFREAGISVTAIGGPGQSFLTDDGAWLAELERALAEHDPDVVVIGGCCGIGLNQGASSDPPGPWATSPLMRLWEERSVRATDLVRDQGRLLLWILSPPARTNGWYGRVEERMDVIRAFNERLAACRRGVGVVDWRVLANPDGSYAEALPDTSGAMVTVRATDGLHFTPAGQRVLAEVTLRDVQQAWATYQRTGGAPGDDDEPRTDCRGLGTGATDRRDVQHAAGASSASAANADHAARK